MQVSDSQKWLIMACVVLLGWLFYRLAPVLTPFAIAGLLAYLGDPLVDRLETTRLSRSLGVTVVFAVMLVLGLGLLLFLGPLLERQVELLINKTPAAVEWVQSEVLPRLGTLPFMEQISLDPDALRTAVIGHWQQLGGVMTGLIGEVFQSGQVVLGWLAYLVLIPVVTFYLLRDWDVLVALIHDLIPRRAELTAVALAKECDAVLGEFMRGQLLVMLALAVIYTTGLWLVGLDVALLIGALAGLVSFVPYLGFVVGIVVAGFAALLQFHDVIHLLYVLAVFGVGQAIEGMVLSPLLVGDRIGLHPVAVIFAVMAGGQLFGFFGVLLALPVAAVVVVLLRHVHQRYVESGFYTP